MQNFKYILRILFAQSYHLKSISTSNLSQMVPTKRPEIKISGPSHDSIFMLKLELDALAKEDILHGCHHHERAAFEPHSYFRQCFSFLPFILEDVGFFLLNHPMKLLGLPPP